MNFLLKIEPDQYSTIIRDTTSLGETLIFGLEIVAIGMIAVFAVLGIIWAVLALVTRYLPGVAPKKKSAATIEQIAEPAPAPVTVPAASSNDELVAVIAAAIAAAESESGNGAKFRVVSFKRK